MLFVVSSYVSVNMHCEGPARGGQKSELDPLELELQDAR